jgi:F420 biosynthesis protein FbiB-like protein
MSMGDSNAPWLPLAADLIAGRRSVRRYEGRKVARSVVEELVRLATCAPSAHNRQPWRFAILSGASHRAKLASAMGERLRRDRLGDGDAPDAVEADVNRSYTRITAAPVVVVVCMTLEHMDSYPDDRRRAAECQMAAQSTAMAVQNLLLAAHAAGLGACWMCAPLFCGDVVQAALDLPQEWVPQALITLGRPAASGKPMSRRPHGDVIRFLDGE